MTPNVHSMLIGSCQWKKLKASFWPEETFLTGITIYSVLTLVLLLHQETQSQYQGTAP